MTITGLNEQNIREIAKIKDEDKWILDYRLKSYQLFNKLDMPKFGPKIDIDFNKIIYYKDKVNELDSSWSCINPSIRSEFEALGVISSEQYMSGMGVQYESEVIYHNMLEELVEKKVIFTSIEVAMKKYPSLVKKYFTKIVGTAENKFTALNGAVFSGGSFIYIPPNTTLERPLQSYFRINSKAMGQFERTLIIVDDNSKLHYIEGCTAPTYSDSSLHAAVVEIYVGKNSYCRYTTVQNWATNVLNLVTKRAVVEENGSMEWVDGNIGSSITMKYPCCVLKGDNSSGKCITIGVATHKQILDSGARMIHIGKNTSSTIISKSIARLGGNASYRGKVEIKKSATNSHAMVKCDSLIVDKNSKSDAYPTNICSTKESSLEHEATVSRINDDALFYLMSRGITKERATELIILGFIDNFTQELPMEYAVELNQLLSKNL